MFNDKDKKSSGVCFGSDADSSHFRSSGDGLQHFGMLMRSLYRETEYIESHLDHI